ncbi:hypothetical protein ACP70R_042311 [Stipagrostis hirtigluma subsp. patula]
MDPGNKHGTAAAAARRGLLVLASAAVALALFGATIDTVFLMQGPSAAADAGAEGVHAASARLAAVAVLLWRAARAPARASTFVSCALLGAATGYGAWDVLRMLAACLGNVHGALAACHVLLLAVMCAGIVWVMAVSFHGGD